MSAEPDLPITGDPVVDIANILDEMGIPYTFTGSLAYSAWVTPAATKDIDVVVLAPGRVALARLFNRLAPLGLDPKRALEDVDAVGYTAVEMPVQPAGKIVVELIYPRLRALNERMHRRAATIPFPGRPQGIRVVTPEDLVTYKLIFFREKDRLHVKDVLARYPDLDAGQILLELRSIYPDTDERIAWLRAAGAAPQPGS